MIPFLLLLSIISCTKDPVDTAAQDTNDSADTATPDTDTDPIDPSSPGTFRVNAATGSVDAAPDCTLDYDLYTPASAPVAPLVVLSHGFMRSAAVLENVARQWASWGFTVVVPDLCHNNIFDSDPAADAATLVALADSMSATSVIYAGHSAGGERSVLAATLDPRTVAVLGMDLVDSDDLALNAAPSLTVPLADALGEPSDCNADNNGIPVALAAPDHVALRVTEADHCDFEDPTEVGCTMLCPGTNDRFTDDEIRTTLRALTTSFLLWKSGLDHRGSAWWTPGDDAYEGLLASGAISVP